MPTLYLLAGPNGSGKTTFYLFALQQQFVSDSLPFVNVDNLKKRYGDYTEENYQKAQLDYRLWVNQLISDQQDFMIESNLADERSYEWINSMKKKGYQLVLYFLSTQDVAINFQRVNKRVQEGGHPVPEPIIES